MSEETKQKIKDTHKKNKEANMGIFKKKNIQTKTFIEGQQQAEDNFREPIPGLKMPKPVVPNRDPVPEPEPNTMKDYINRIGGQGSTGYEEPLQQQPKTVKLVPGYYFWVDEYGDICFKHKRP